MRDSRHSRRSGRAPRRRSASACRASTALFQAATGRLRADVHPHSRSRAPRGDQVRVRKRRELVQADRRHGAATLQHAVAQRPAVLGGSRGSDQADGREAEEIPHAGGGRRSKHTLMRSEPAASDPAAMHRLCGAPRQAIRRRDRLESERPASNGRCWSKRTRSGPFRQADTRYADQR